MSVDLDDLRREPRKDAEKTITVKFLDSEKLSQEKTLLCRSQDISAGGIKLISHYPLPLSGQLPMEIDLGDMWAVITVTAEVKWCLEIDESPTYYIGVKLVDIEKSNKQVWQKFIEKL
jgi:c-di-GMP-binding flagellar brake protein YcgR